MTGIVRNVVDFGAFVDIGLKESALLHRSKLFLQYGQDPMSVLNAGQSIPVTVVSLDKERGRVGVGLQRTYYSNNNRSENNTNQNNNNNNNNDDNIDIPKMKKERYDSHSTSSDSKKRKDNNSEKTDRNTTEANKKSKYEGK